MSKILMIYGGATYFVTVNHVQRETSLKMLLINDGCSLSVYVKMLII